MLFNSWTFVVFLLIVFVGCHFGPGWLSRTAVGQTGWLALASRLRYLYRRVLPRGPQYGVREGSPLAGWWPKSMRRVRVVPRPRAA